MRCPAFAHKRPSALPISPDPTIPIFMPSLFPCLAAAEHLAAGCLAFALYGIRAMSRTHDLGGATGFGEIETSAGDEPFHHEWEARVFALNRVLLSRGAYTLDEFRYAVERMSAEHYHASSYYERWLHAIETLLAEKGLLS